LYIEQKINYDKDFLYDGNSSICWCCDNYILIHPSNVDIFIKKYIKDENEKINENNIIRPSSLLIKILYRLYPECFNNYDISKINYINKLFTISHSADSYCFVYDSYFKSDDKSFDNLEYYSCTICKNIFCEKHIIFNPFYSSKCKYCKNYWNICTWCKNEKLKIFFKKNKLDYEKSLCDIFHSSKKCLI
jgi:hypothetical protein